MCVQRTDLSERMIICRGGQVDRLALQLVDALEQVELFYSVSVVSPADTEVLVAVLIYYVQLWRHMTCLGCPTLWRRLSLGA